MWTGRGKRPSGSRYPPVARRSSGQGQARSIWGINGIDYRHTINDNMLVVIMIETPTGVANAYDIASVPGVDVVIVGNNDLSQFSGYAQTDARYQEMITKIHDDDAEGGQDLRPGQRRSMRRDIRSARTRSSSRTAHRTMAGRRPPALAVAAAAAARGGAGAPPAPRRREGDRVLDAGRGARRLMTPETERRAS